MSMEMTWANRSGEQSVITSTKNTTHLEDW